MNDQEPTQAEIELERDRRGLPEPENDPGFSGLHTRETWDEVSQTLLKIEQTAVTLQRQAKQAQYYAGAAGSLLFMLEQDPDQVVKLFDALDFDTATWAERLNSLKRNTADSDKWAVASADTQITLHELNLLWDKLQVMSKDWEIH